MQITALTIKNFKGIGEQGARIDFAPITMLFGPNNAGKSTIIQALHLAKEIFCHNNLNPDKVEGGADKVDLGGFQSFVHNHDLNRVVSLRFDLNVDRYSWPLPTYYDDLDITIEPEAFGECEVILARINTISIEVGISWSQQHNAPIPDYQSIYINNQLTLTINWKQSGGLIELPPLKLSHLVLGWPEVSSRDADKCWGQEQNCHHMKTDDLLIDEARELIPEILTPLIDLSEFLAACGIQDKEINNYGQDFDNFEHVMLKLPRDKFPDWHSRLPITITQNIDTEFDTYMANSFKSICSALVSSMVIGPGKLVGDILNQFQHIGPLRAIPQRNYKPLKTFNSDRWADGLAAWDILADTASQQEINIVNRWLDSADTLNTGYTVKRQHILPVEANGPLTAKLQIALQEDGWLDENTIPFLRQLLASQPEKRLKFKNTKTGTLLDPCDLGVGISQIIPIIVATSLLKRDAFIAIEQPELHIHPAWQTVLGDLFINAIAKDDPPLVLLETHSEHLMLRLLRRIRETSEEVLPAEFPNISPEIISVIYVQPDEDGLPQITNLPITPDGDFEKKWPNGFFHEREEEIF